MTALRARSRRLFTGTIIGKGTMNMPVRSRAIGMCVRFGQLGRFLHNVRRYRPPLKQNLAFLLDTADRASLRLHTEGGCGSSLASAPRAAYTMDEIRRRLRKVIVHNMGHAVDVDAPSCNVSRDQNSVPAVAKSRQSLIPLVLCAVTVHRYGG